jgi:hypothetical protein
MRTIFVFTPSCWLTTLAVIGSRIGAERLRTARRTA